MQQTKSYWRLVAVAGVVSAFVASACVVTTNDDDSAGTAGSGTAGSGTAGSGTAGAAGSGTAGAAGSAGAAGAAGSSSLGGSGPGIYQCDPAEGGAQGEPNDCTPVDATDDCQKCVQAKCCSEYEACYATMPGNQCGWGGPAKINKEDNKGGEALCIELCIQDGVQLSGTSPDAELVGTCGSSCASNPGNGAIKDCGSVIGTQTSYLINCLMDNCSKVCFGPLDP